MSFRRGPSRFCVTFSTRIPRYVSASDLKVSDRSHVLEHVSCGFDKTLSIVTSVSPHQSITSLPPLFPKTSSRRILTRSCRAVRCPQVRGRELVPGNVGRGQDPRPRPTRHLAALNLGRDESRGSDLCGAFPPQSTLSIASLYRRLVKLERERDLGCVCFGNEARLSETLVGGARRSRPNSSTTVSGAACGVDTLSRTKETSPLDTCLSLKESTPL